MELKVWVDGIQRVVCGISDQTTCQEVIYALAHATGKTGRFVLVEKWRTSERSLSPHDKPLELLLKWGEYSNDVQFVLRCLEESTYKSPVNVRRAMSPPSVTNTTNLTNATNNSSSNVVKSRLPNLLLPTSSSATVSPSGGIISPPKQRIVRDPTPTPEQQALKPYFVDASRPSLESGTLRPASAAPQHVRYGSELPHNLAAQQTTVLAANIPPPSVGRPESRNGFGKRNLTVLSQSAHENLSAFGGVGNNSSLMESSFSSSDLHNVSGASCQSSSLSSSGGSSRRQPVPPSPSQLPAAATATTSSSSAVGKGLSPARRRPPPPSYEQVMNHRRNYTNILIQSSSSAVSSPSPSATVSRSGTPIITTHNGPNSNFGQTSPTPPSNWPANRDQLLKIVESQQNLITQQENKLRAIDHLIELERQKLAEIEKHYNYGGGVVGDQMQKELQQLEVRRVHIKQNAEEIRRQDFDVQLNALRQNCATTTSECRTTKEKTATLDREISIKQNIADKLSNELKNDTTSTDLFVDDDDDDLDLNDFDVKLIEFEEKIREKKKLIETLESTLIKENSLELLSSSLSTLKQLQVDKQQIVDAGFVRPTDNKPTLTPIIKETTPGVWV